MSQPTMDSHVPDTGSFTLCIAQTRRRFVLRPETGGRWLVRSSHTVPNGSATIRSERFLDEAHARDAYLTNLVRSGTTDCDALLDGLAHLRATWLHGRPGFRRQTRSLADLVIAGAVRYAAVAMAYATAIRALGMLPEVTPRWLVCALNDSDAGRSDHQVGQYIAAEMLR